MTKFNVGDFCFYQECPPNWAKMRELCIFTCRAISMAQEDFASNSKAIVEIIEVFEAEEEEDGVVIEPEYRIRFINNDRLAEQWKGYGIAFDSELSRLPSQYSIVRLPGLEFGDFLYTFPGSQFDYPTPELAVAAIPLQSLRP